MGSQNPLRVRPREIPATYRVMRAIVRIFVRVFFPGLRLINPEKLDQSGPAILLVTHPRSLPVALLLVAALDRQVRCLVPSGQLRGVLRKLAGPALGIQAFDSLLDDQNSLLNPCLSVLANQGAIALFAEPFPQDDGQRAPAAGFAARLALETLLQAQGQIQPAIYPVHWFLGPDRRASEPLVYVEGPLHAHHFLPKVGEDVTEASRRLAETIESAISANIFGLAEPELERFSHELEDLSREHLQQQWSQRPDWKQRPEELELSSFAREWLDQQNRTDPARLVELRESLDAYREARRQCSLGQLIVENSGPWQTSVLRVAAAWIETVLGFPIALYGLLNHLPAAIVLSISGLFKHSSKRDPKVEWLLRIFVVLSFYTIQIFLVNFGWGRATAGYYALTLPVSGAYLWRYRWIAQHRARLLFLKALEPARSARLARRRENILGRFGRELERWRQSPGMPGGPSPDLAE
ncbi:MAG TPA: hypothetical protein VNG91_07320 [Terriglobia bacterium]|nr:hypothetical protein [Terriglobia bacterium]